MRIKDHQAQTKNQVFIKGTSRDKRMEEKIKKEMPKYRLKRRSFSFIDSSN